MLKKDKAMLEALKYIIQSIIKLDPNKAFPKVYFDINKLLEDA